MSTDIEYPDYVDSVESVGKIREISIDSSRGPWGQVDDPAVWVKLAKIGNPIKGYPVGRRV